MGKILKDPEYNKIAVRVCVTVFLSIVLVLAVFNLSDILGTVGAFLRGISPILTGFALAYVLTPVCRIGERLFAFADRKTSERRRGPAPSVWLGAVFAYLVLLAFVVLFIVLLVPQIRSSYEDLVGKGDEYLAAVQTKLRELEAAGRLPSGFDQIAAFFDKASLSDLVSGVIGDSFAFLDKVGNLAVEYASKIAVAVFRAALAVALSFLFVVFRRRIAEALNRTLSLLLGGKVFNGVYGVARLTDKYFGGFITGKLLDSLIIGILSFIVFAIFRIPYYPLIALVMGITNMIPYFGPLIGIVFGAFILIIPSPGKAVLFAVLGLLIQQLDGNVIGPKILGDSMGLNSFWILISITVMGNILGVWGMLLGAPIFAVVGEIIQNQLNKRLIAKRIYPDTLKPMGPAEPETEREETP
ncbi:MAG: AI-2E family transporter [Clostridia bacterium]|nr:AI-2E family transporter [Clostridia bacterium]